MQLQQLVHICPVLHRKGGTDQRTLPQGMGFSASHGDALCRVLVKHIVREFYGRFALCNPALHDMFKIAGAALLVAGTQEADRVCKIHGVNSAVVIEFFANLV